MQRWVAWFAGKNHEVHLITDHPVPMKKIIIHDISWKTDARPRYVRYWGLGFNLKFIRFFKTILKIRKLVKTIKRDILHLQTLYYPSYLGVFTNFRPMVVTPWDGDVLLSLKRSLVHKFLVKCALSCADLITYNSVQMKNSCMNFVVKENKLRMIQCPGADVKSFYPQEKNVGFSKSLSLGNSPVILSTRGIAPEYNIDVIVQAIPFVLEKTPHAKFVFIWHSGSEEEIKKITKLIHALKIESAVRLSGKKGYTELPQYFNNADVFVSISSKDSAPMSLLEAMACGLPPVTADHPAVNELVKDGWNGYVVPQRDTQATAQAIIKLLEDGKMRRLFAERNLQWVRENGDYDQNMTKVEELYFLLAKKTNLAEELK